MGRLDDNLLQEFNKLNRKVSLEENLDSHGDIIGISTFWKRCSDMRHCNPGYPERLTWSISAWRWTLSWTRTWAQRVGFTALDEILLDMDRVPPRTFQRPMARTAKWNDKPWMIKRQDMPYIIFLEEKKAFDSAFITINIQETTNDLKCANRVDTLNVGFNELCQTILIQIKNKVMHEVESIANNDQWEFISKFGLL